MTTFSADRCAPGCSEMPVAAQAGVRAWLRLLLGIHLAAAGTIALPAYLVRDATGATPDQHPIWVGLSMAAAAVGWWSSQLTRRARVCQQTPAAWVSCTLALTALAPALAVCAIAMITSTRYPQALNAPVVTIVRPAVAVSDAGPALSAALATSFQAEAQRGLKVYGNACAACHGTGGEGVDNVAPALAATPFLTERTDEQMIAFLQAGRAPSDPDSKMGRAMPARGGNPSLTDHDLADIVAHLRTLLAASGPADNSPRAATPPRWLAPPPAAPVAGVAAVHRQPTWLDVDGVQRLPVRSWQADWQPRCLLAMGGCQILLLLTIAALLLRGSRVAMAAAQADLRHAQSAWILAALMAAVYAFTLAVGGTA